MDNTSKQPPSQNPALNRLFVGKRLQKTVFFMFSAVRWFKMPGESPSRCFSYVV